ncbi:MAG: ABC transporter six-transmembrane domain-containing protein [Cohaesibacter sp.]|nr:ABC transporter six-transmembrane domain-containing protein [Cohaesibacter sp.]
MARLLKPRPRLRSDRPLTLKGLLKAFWPQIGITWAMTLLDVGLTALIPLLMGRAIDDLLESDYTSFLQLGAVLSGLILCGTLRRVYDTRAYGLMRVELGRSLGARSSGLPVSNLNARLDMGRELVDFLEEEVPESFTALLSMIAAVAILMSFHFALAAASVAAFFAMLAIYGMAHARFFRLNRQLNEQTERQVSILQTGRSSRLGGHLMRLRKSEIQISDTEALIYGLIFVVLLGLVMFNLHFSTQHITASIGVIFAIVTYSWNFVESALALPMTLQSLSRLSEIVSRINQPLDTTCPNTTSEF